MKHLPIIVAAIAAALTSAHAGLTDGMKTGSPSLGSAGPLAFAPEGILIVSDPKAAAVHAFATGDTDEAAGTKENLINVDEAGKKIAALLGTSADDIRIVDVAVNPLSHHVYVSVSRGRGPDAAGAIVKVEAGTNKLSLVDLGKLKFSSFQLGDAPKDEISGQGRRRSNKRLESVTDLSYLDGKVVIAGLSNEEFASSLRMVDFPFTGKSAGSSIEIFHGAHGKEETHSPIRTLMPMNVAGEPNIIASYTCTPLVRIPVKSLKPKEKVKGVTIAELGNRNRPLDMIQYEKDGKTWILIANSARGVMKVDTEKIATVESIGEKISGTAGLPYDTIEDWKGIVQLDRLGDGHAVVLRETEGGAQHLEQLALP